MDFQVSVIGIIVVLAFYLPGYFFRKGYYSGFSTKQIGMEEWYDRFFKSIFYGALLQFLIIKILHDNFTFNFDSASAPVNQLYRYFQNNKLPDLSYINYRTAIAYLFVSTLFAGATGFVLRQIIRKARIDVYFTVFRYANIWHYYFRGDILQTNDFQTIAQKGKWVSTRADVLVDFEKDEKNVLYSGVISQYDLSPKSDKLERIYLTQAMRYSAKTGSEGFKSIPGDILVLEYSRVINMNLSYDFIETKKGRKKAIIAAALGVVTITILFSPIYLIPHFFYGKVNLLHTILGIIAAMISLVYLLACVMIITQNKFYQKYPKGSRTGTFFIALLVSVASFAFFLFQVGVIK